MTLDELREVLVGESPDGVCWVVRAGADSNGGFYTSINRSLGDATAESGMGGEALAPGRVINFWIGQADGTPLFVMARTAPRVRTRHRRAREWFPARSVDVPGHRGLRPPLHCRTAT